VEYGGTCTCGECLEPGHAVTPGQCLPPPPNKSDEELARYLGFQTFVVHSGSTETRTIECPNVDDTLFWLWCLEAKDIGFGATFTPAGEERCAGAAVVQLVFALTCATQSPTSQTHLPLSHSPLSWHILIFKSHRRSLIAVTGVCSALVVVAQGLMERNKHVFKPTKPGKLTLTFSNAHSRFTKKTVHLRVIPSMSPHEAFVRDKSPFSDAAGYAVDRAALEEVMVRGNSAHAAVEAAPAADAADAHGGGAEAAAGK
jgi:hypothetical protein